MPDLRPDEVRAVDQWIQRSLIERFSPTLREPLPDALVRLLDGKA